MSSELPTESETKPETKHQVIFLTEEEASKPSTVNYFLATVKFL